MSDGSVLIIQHQAIGQPGTILETLTADGVAFDLRNSCTGTLSSRRRTKSGSSGAHRCSAGPMNTDQ